MPTEATQSIDALSDALSGLGFDLRTLLSELTVVLNKTYVDDTISAPPPDIRHRVETLSTELELKVCDLLDLSTIAANSFEPEWDDLSLQDLSDLILGSMPSTIHVDADPVLLKNGSTRVSIDGRRVSRAVAMLTEDLSRQHMPGTRYTLSWAVDTVPDMLLMTVTPNEAPDAVVPAEPKIDTSGALRGLANLLLEGIGGKHHDGHETSGSSGVTIEIPVKSLTRSHGEAPTHDASDTDAILRILIVDDNSANRLLLERMVTALGHQSETANDGNAGLSAFGRSKFDVVLMDIMMPVMDGVECMKLMRRLNRDTPVVACTAHAMPGDSDRFLAEGFDDYLSKPIAMPHLSKILARYASSMDRVAADGHAGRESDN